MKTIQIELNKTGYEPFLDFLKAYAIICVLIGHTFPFLNKIGYPLWTGLQVPIFVLIQAFHVLKKPSSTLNFKKLFFRIILPFFIIQLGISIFCLIEREISLTQSLDIFLYGGGVWTWILLSLDLYSISNFITLFYTFI